jgi:DNA processing protein
MRAPRVSWRMDASDRLDRALLVAAAIPDERDLGLLYRSARDAPAAAPHAPGEAPHLAAGLSPKLRERLEALALAGAAAEQRELAARLGFELVAWGDARWPAPLADLAGPPPVLWLRGSGPWPPAEAITIVGARASTARGRAFARDLGAGIADRGGSVVSGLAIGIDQSSHEGAIAAGGACYAILACGVDQIYPPGAAPLAGRIERAGRIVSEMPPGTPPYRDYFPRRNRLLAALAKATLVVEADLRSGSLVTAHRALELGRGVHAMPGAIDAPTSRGTNLLIRDGAHPLLAVEDLDLLLSAPKRGALRGSDDLLDALTAPVGVDALAQRLGVAVDRLLLRLVELEADGRVARLGGGLYARLP